MFGFEPVDLLPFILVGFLAQLVDGALGMAFGVISNTLLVTATGLSPAAASASVHLVEVFTTGASGVSHAAHRNIDWKLFARLAIPGMIGGVAGAYLLTQIDASVAKPVVMAYLACIGIYLLIRSRGLIHSPREPKVIAPLGLAGGFLDAAGGGGWGPIVTSNLLVQGTSPRMTVGTVNAAEFCLTLVVSVTFIFHLGITAFTVATTGLLLGGLAAAPFGAYFAKRIEPPRLMFMVGLVLLATSLYSLYRALS